MPCDIISVYCIYFGYTDISSLENDLIKQLTDKKQRILTQKKGLQQGVKLNSLFIYLFNF